MTSLNLLATLLLEQFSTQSAFSDERHTADSSGLSSKAPGSSSAKLLSSQSAPEPALMNGVIPSQVKNLGVVFVQPNNVAVIPLLQLDEVFLNGSLALQCISCPHPSSVLIATVSLITMAFNIKSTPLFNISEYEMLPTSKAIKKSWGCWSTAG